MCQWRLWAAALVVVLALGELGLRLTGYASPLLYVADPDYEYFPAPNQRTHRLGVRLETNALGMRSPDLSATTGERILVMGDSVVSAINWTDQRALATTLLANRGHAVMNVSAGSWGPGNMLAYVERHGVHDARRVIFVLSAHDFFDDRQFAPLNGYATPPRAPRVALVRAFDHYVLGGPAREAQRSERPGIPGDAQASLNALLGQLTSDGVDVCIVRHWSRPELSQGAAPGAAEIAATAAAHDVRVIEADSLYRDGMARGEVIFRDDIHPNDRGQALLAELMGACLAQSR
jgi:hypothetical protein